MTRITTVLWSFTQSQTSWSVKSSGPKEASLQTKLVEVMEFQLSYFKPWKMMLWTCCTDCVSKFGKLSSGHRTGKDQFSFESQRRAVPKMFKLLNNCSHCTASKVMLIILQARLQQYMNQELPGILLRSLKRQRNKISNCQYSLNHGESKGILEKHLLHLLHYSLWLPGSQQTGEFSPRHVFTLFY